VLIDSRSVMDVIRDERGQAWLYWTRLGIDAHPAANISTAPKADVWWFNLASYSTVFMSLAQLHVLQAMLALRPLTRPVGASECIHGSTVAESKDACALCLLDMAVLAFHELRDELLLALFAEPGSCCIDVAGCGETALGCRCLVAVLDHQVDSPSKLDYDGAVKQLISRCAGSLASRPCRLCQGMQASAPDALVHKLLHRLWQAPSQVVA